MMFAFIGSAALYVATNVLTVNGTLPPNVVMAALANGFMLAVASARLSTAHTSVWGTGLHCLIHVHILFRCSKSICHRRHRRATICHRCRAAADLLVCASVFATANISGGHITPTVTIATMITGAHITPRCRCSVSWLLLPPAACHKAALELCT